jgi:hypothetical protein
MGNIISHIKMAIGIDTCAYSNRPKISGMCGRYRLTKMPTAIQRNTQMDKYFSKKLIPL